MGRHRKRRRPQEGARPSGSRPASAGRYRAPDPAVAVASVLALLILVAVSALLWPMLRRSRLQGPELARATTGGSVQSPGRGPLGAGPASPAILLGVVALSVAASAYFTSTSGFYSDDFVNFREIQVEDGLSVRYLLSPTSAHFAPAHKLGDWLLHTVAPLNFSVAQGIILLGFAGSLLVFHKVLRELFDPTPALVLTFVYGTSMVHVAVQQWWSSGMDRVPATLFTFLRSWVTSGSIAVAPTDGWPFQSGRCPWASCSTSSRSSSRSIWSSCGFCCWSPTSPYGCRWPGHCVSGGCGCSTSFP